MKVVSVGEIALDEGGELGHTFQGAGNKSLIERDIGRPSAP